jgi:hypothetical protein
MVRAVSLHSYVVCEPHSAQLRIPRQHASLSMVDTRLRAKPIRDKVARTRRAKN